MAYSMVAIEEEEIVIVGGGIVGLATALALHKKGMKSVVLERSESLRATGATIVTFLNGWRCLDQLGVGEELREKALLFHGTREVLLDEGIIRYTPHNDGEQRCIKRRDLMEALAYRLPPSTIRFNSQVVVINKLDHPNSSYFYSLVLHDGRIIHSKVLIGCDGWNSMVAQALGYCKPPKTFPLVGVRGFTYYPQPHYVHGFRREYLRIRNKDYYIGTTPVDDHTIAWFLARKTLPSDREIVGSGRKILDSTLKLIQALPSEDVMGMAKRSVLEEMVKKSELDSVAYTIITCRPPWQMLQVSRQLRRGGTMTIAGDAMHVMGPFLQQGSASGLEDAITLARCMAAQPLISHLPHVGKDDWRRRAEAGIDKYLQERELRLLKLSMQSYLTGLSASTSSSTLRSLLCLLLLLMFRHSYNHTLFDIGRL